VHWKFLISVVHDPIILVKPYIYRMKTWILTLLLLVSSKLFAQTMEVKTDLKKLKYYEDYFVLQGDTSIKEGQYTKYFAWGNEVVCTGFYKSNMKDGLWVEYQNKGMVADSGNYKQDKKVGVWAAYKSGGMLQILYDYTAQQLLYLKRDSDWKTKIYTVMDGATKKQTILDRPPVYLDGEAALNHVVGSSLIYPREAAENHIKGKVTIGVLISEQGKAKEYSIIKPLEHGCDEAALKAAKNLNGKWLAGVLDGKPVAAEYDINVSFASYP
jgi:TonB family protein